MTNLEQYFTVFDKAKLHKQNCKGKHCLCTYPRHTEICIIVVFLYSYSLTCIDSWLSTEICIIVVFLYSYR